MLVGDVNKPHPSSSSRVARRSMLYLGACAHEEGKVCVIHYRAFALLPFPPVDGCSQPARRFSTCCASTPPPSPPKQSTRRRTRCRRARREFQAALPEAAPLWQHRDGRRHRIRVPVPSARSRARARPPRPPRPRRSAIISGGKCYAYFVVSGFQAHVCVYIPILSSAHRDAWLHRRDDNFAMPPMYAAP